MGLGGHAEALLRAARPGAVLVGIDLDRSNLLRAKALLAPLEATHTVRLFEANFASIREVLAEAGLAHADALLADLGVSSSQLDDPRRGLSFSARGPSGHEAIHWGGTRR